MVGRRVPDGSQWYGDDGVQPGGYGRTKVDGRWQWRCRTPNGHFGHLDSHEVTEHEDGTITVSPSILVTMPGTGEGWHGYLERGVWREA